MNEVHIKKSSFADTYVCEINKKVWRFMSDLYISEKFPLLLAVFVLNYE